MHLSLATVTWSDQRDAPLHCVLHPLPPSIALETWRAWRQLPARDAWRRHRLPNTHPAVSPIPAGRLISLQMAGTLTALISRQCSYQTALQLVQESRSLHRGLRFHWGSQPPPRPLAPASKELRLGNAPLTKQVCPLPRPPCGSNTPRRRPVSLGSLSK